MNAKRFNEVLDARLAKTKMVLFKKAQEYQSDDDRLHNFKRAAEINQESSAEALWGMASKHLVSVLDMIDGAQEPTAFMIDEKIGDMINYLILLEAVLLEGIDDE